MKDKQAIFANEIKAPNPPGWMNRDAKTCWRKIVKALPPDWFRDSDLPLLESYCVSYSQMRDALATLEVEGNYTHNAAGSQIAHPAMKVVHDSQQRMANIAVKCRICPNARHSDNSATSARAGKPKGTTGQGGKVVRAMFGK